VAGFNDQLYDVGFISKQPLKTVVLYYLFILVLMCHF